MPPPTPSAPTAAQLDPHSDNEPPVVDPVVDPVQPQALPGTTADPHSPPDGTWGTLPRTPATPPPSSATGARPKQPPPTRKPKDRPPPLTVRERRDEARQQLRDSRRHAHEPRTPSTVSPTTPPQWPPVPPASRRRLLDSTDSDDSTYPQNSQIMVKSHRDKRQDLAPPPPYIATPWETPTRPTGPQVQMLFPPRLLLPPPQQQPADSNMAFDQRRQEARQYAQLRAQADEAYQAAAQAHRPEVCRVHDNGQEWLRMHQSLFDIMNPPAHNFFTYAELGSSAPSPPPSSASSSAAAQRPPTHLTAQQLDTRRLILSEHDLPPIISSEDLADFGEAFWTPPSPPSSH